MLNLIIDIGNSKLKASIWKGDSLILHKELSHKDFEEAVALIDSYDIEAAIVSNVGKEMPVLIKSIKEKLGENVFDFSFDWCETCDIDYSSTLGVDRLAAYKGAIVSFPGFAMLVIDAGTALTVDIIDSNGHFCGGNISLGLKSRLQAIHDATARLPLISPALPDSAFGNDTHSAILDGALNGVIGEILYSLKKANELYKIDCVMLTGGEAPLIYPLLQEENVNCFHDPYLVERGLNACLNEKLCEITPSY